MLADQLGLADPVAIALVRRGHRTVEQARTFLDANEAHDPERFEGIDSAIAAIEHAIARGQRITIHGDYDVDGMCSTAILVGAMRRAGAECDWVIPDRLADGYGLSAASIEHLRERGTGLLITADCGIGSAAEIETVKGMGIAAVVTDHHHPGTILPDCPIVHPEVSAYPFTGLCGAAVAHKLVAAFERSRGLTGPADESRDLDLVALATIADLVPLVGENRSLARRGLAELRKARRPGLRALLTISKVEPEFLDEGDIAFRIAPRLNAAGRLYRADAGVELMLTDDDARANTIAAELDAANHERRETERGVTSAAESALRALPESARDAGVLVIAGEGWHPGVVGIVASRIVEHHGKPAIILSIDASGQARGSGRSVPGFDLLAALDACASHLDRYGGHRAAAGVELPAAGIEAFREALAAHSAAVMPDGGLAEPERIDAFVGAEALDLRVAEQLEALAPFGQGNPGVRLLIPSAQIGDIRPMGQEGRHARFNVSTGGLSARAVAFDANGALEAAQRAPHDLTVRLEVNHWNGGVEPRAILSGAHGRDRPAAREETSGHACAAAEDRSWWWDRFDLELGRDLGAAISEPIRPAALRTPVNARRGSVVARITELLSSGERVMVITADAARRSALLDSVGPSRLGVEGATICMRCSPRELAGAGERGCGLLITDWSSLSGARSVAEEFDHLVLVDPPASAALEGIAMASEGFAHKAWGAAEELAELCWESEWGLRSALAEIYRGLAARELGPGELLPVLEGAGRFGRSPEAAARCVRVLDELGIAAGGGSGDARWLRVVSSERTVLERSDAWRVYSNTHQEGVQYLRNRRAER